MAKATFSANQLIVLCVDTNPKRGVSAARFDLYFSCGTVGEYLAAGGTRADILWDLERGYILLDEEGAPVIEQSVDQTEE